MSRTVSCPCVFNAYNSFSTAQSGGDKCPDRESGPVRWSDSEPGGGRFTGGHQRKLIQHNAARLVLEFDVQEMEEI